MYLRVTYIKYVAVCIEYFVVRIYVWPILLNLWRVYLDFLRLQQGNFEMDQEGMKLQLNQLNQLLQVVDRSLYNYLGESVISVY